MGPKAEGNLEGTTHTYGVVDTDIAGVLMLQKDTMMLPSVLLKYQVETITKLSILSGTDSVVGCRDKVDA